MVDDQGELQPRDIAQRLRETDTAENGAAYLKELRLDRASLLAVATELHVTRADRLNGAQLKRRVLEQAITARRKFEGLRNWGHPVEKTARPSSHAEEEGGQVAAAEKERVLEEAQTLDERLLSAEALVANAEQERDDYLRENRRILNADPRYRSDYERIDAADSASSAGGDGSSGSGTDGRPAPISREEVSPLSGPEFPVAPMTTAPGISPSTPLARQFELDKSDQVAER